MTQTKVSFNQDQKKLYDDLFVKNMISQAFPDFVKDAYHDKIDTIRTKNNLDLSPAKVEELTFDAVKAETQNN